MRDSGPTPTTHTHDWLKTTALPELRALLVVELCAAMAETDAARLALPPIGRVDTRLRLEALLAATSELAAVERTAPFVVHLTPQHGDEHTAAEALLSMAMSLASLDGPETTSGPTEPRRRRLAQLPRPLPLSGEALA